MKGNKSKAAEVFSGIVIMFAVWIIGILFSGEWTTAEAIDIDVFPERFIKPLTTAFPFLLIALLIAIGVFSAVKGKKALFITSLIATVMPLVNWGLSALTDFCFPEGTILLVPFILLCSPIRTLINFPPCGDGAEQLISAIAFPIIACVGGIIAYAAVKRKNKVIQSDNHPSENAKIFPSASE